MFELCFGCHCPNIHRIEFLKHPWRWHWYQFLCNIPICARSMLIELPILFGWLTLNFLSKQCYRYAYYHRSPQRFFLKTRGTWTTSLTWKKIPCNIPFCSICYFLFTLWVPFWGTSIGPLFMNGFNSIESTLLEDPCTAISQTVTVLLLKKKKLKNQCIPMLNFKPLTGFLVLVRW